MTSRRLLIELCDIPLCNPVIAASGTFGYGVEFASLVDLTELGAIVVKGLSREPMKGNPPPRIWETEGGMINSIGLQNIGVRAFVAEKLPYLRHLPTPVFANVFGFTDEDYCEVVRVLEDAEGIRAYELNVSCPNTRHGGIVYSQHPKLLFRLVAAVRRISRRPLLVKLSPNVTYISEVCRAAEQAGADGLCLINTFPALAIDARAARPRLGGVFGGLSGPAIKPIALRLVLEAAQSVKIPIIGMGGIATGEDAAEFLLAGARAVQVGTATFWDPGAPLRIARELDHFMAEQGYDHMLEIIGGLKWQEEW